MKFYAYNRGDTEMMFGGKGFRSIDALTMALAFLALKEELDDNPDKLSTAELAGMFDCEVLVLSDDPEPTLSTVYPLPE